MYNILSFPQYLLHRLDPSPSNRQNSAQPCKVGELQHRHTPTSAWKEVGSVTLRPVSPALPELSPENKRLEHLGGLAPWGQGAVCTKADNWHPPRSFPFSQGRQFLMQSWKFSATSLCACSWGRGLWVDFWKQLCLLLVRISVFSVCYKTINLQPTFLHSCFLTAPFYRWEKMQMKQ